LVFIFAIVQLKLNGETFLPRTKEVRQLLRDDAPYILASGIFGGLGTVFLNLAYQSGEVSVVSAIAGSAVIVAIAGAAIFYRERLTLIQYSGAGLVLLGIVLTAIV
jgi:uncharacterized membrane protein